MINIHLLKTFCTLAEIGHFTQTSHALFMTQSGVSQHIKKLEDQLDTALLIREGKSFSLTDAGKKLYLHGQALIKNTEDLASLVKQDDPLSGVVKIASPGSIGLKLYTHLLDLQKKTPNLIIDYSFAPNTLIEQGVSERNIDIGLLTELSKSNQLLNQQITTEPLTLVTPKAVKSINWQTLEKLGFISHPDAEHHANLLLKENFVEFKHINQFPHKGFSNQISLILEPVSRGIGFTVLPLHAVKAFHNQDHIKAHALPISVSEPLYLCSNEKTFETKRSQYVKSVINSFLNKA